MSKILAIKAIKTKLGKPVILVTTAEKDHWCAYGMWTAKGNSEALDAYVGGEFSGDYYQEGEVLLSGDPVTQSDIILRDFSASMNPEVTARVAALGIAAKAESMNDAALLFRRRRTEKLAADAKAAAAAAITPVVAGVAGA